jgi:UPF0755 protein
MLRRIVLVVALLGLIGGGIWLVRPWFAEPPVAPAAAPTRFTVAKGASLTAVAGDLKDAGLIASPQQFLLLTKLLGDGAAVQAGRYAIPPGSSWADILKILQSGAVERQAITIPEGLPAVLVAERLLAEKSLTGPVEVPAEGSVLPETYEIEPGEPRAKVLARMQAAMTETLDELWKDRAPSAVVKTPEEAIILASIVEKETGKASERRMVAGVYSNRLRQGMKLDADPTVVYPVTRGKPLGRRIRRSELQADTGYNTYLKPGLPVGPIANPGRASIAAVLDPADTQALFFVADGSGGHVFAATLAEHNANVAKWYALRRERGEM